MSEPSTSTNDWKRRTPIQAFTDIVLSTTLFAMVGGVVTYAILAPPSLREGLWSTATCFMAGLCVTLANHRYFSHKSFKTHRLTQALLALGSCWALQKGPLWWAANHRAHHRHSDTPDDPHSPIHGIWWSHMGWTLHPNTHKARKDPFIADLLKFPELHWMDRLWFLPPLLYLALLFIWGGVSAMIWGYLLPILIQFQFTYLVNSACHLWGGQPFHTDDTSRNNVVVALLTLGEGWHNNHHRCQFSARQGFFWYEIDVTYWVICALERLGIIWDVKRPPARIYAERSKG